MSTNIRDQAMIALRRLPVEDRVIVSAYVEQEVRRRARSRERLENVGWVLLCLATVGILFGSVALLNMSEQDDQTCREWAIQALGGTP